MPRSLRIEFPGAWYHVMNRGLGRRSIFASDKDRQTFLKLLGDISEAFRVEVHAYSLMNNHYHLLIHTPEGKLSRAMRHLNGMEEWGQGLTACCPNRKGKVTCE